MAADVWKRMVARSWRCLARFSFAHRKWSTSLTRQTRNQVSPDETEVRKVNGIENMKRMPGRTRMRKMVAPAARPGFMPLEAIHKPVQARATMSAMKRAN